MSDFRSKLSFDVLAGLHDDAGASSPARRKRRHSKKKKKKKEEEEEEVGMNNNGLFINSNCRTVESVVYEEAFLPPEEKRVYPVSREVTELRQRSSFSSFGEAVSRIEENVKEVDDGGASRGESELMMKQTAEMNLNVNGHHLGRMLEKDNSLDWKQLMADKDPNCELSIFYMFFCYWLWYYLLCCG